MHAVENTCWHPLWYLDVRRTANMDMQASGHYSGRQTCARPCMHRAALLEAPELCTYTHHNAISKTWAQALLAAMRMSCPCDVEGHIPGCE